MNDYKKYFFEELGALMRLDISQNDSTTTKRVGITVCHNQKYPDSLIRNDVSFQETSFYLEISNLEQKR